MAKRNLILMLGLAAGMMFTAAPKAHAGVIVGVRVGAPVFAYPAPPVAYVAPGYIAPRAVVTLGPAPFYRHVYVAPRPVYYGHYYPNAYWRREHVVRRDYGWRR